MSEFVLDDISFQLDIDYLLKIFSVRKGSSNAEELKYMASDALAIAKPKVVYKSAFIESKGDDYVVIDGVTFTSRVLRVNLEQAQRVFPYMATCGTELDYWSRSIDGMLQSYWADMIKEMALNSAIQSLNEDLEDRFRPRCISSMSPGSLEDWPIQEQQKLFALFRNLEESIGIHLMDNLLMIPIKSVSGIRFPTDISFESCQLCPRKNCPARKAPYDKTLYDRKYRLNNIPYRSAPMHRRPLLSFECARSAQDALNPPAP